MVVPGSLVPGQLAQIQVLLGRNKKISSCQATLGRYGQEVKSMSKMK